MNNCHYVILVSLVFLLVCCNKSEDEGVCTDIIYSEKIISFRNNDSLLTKAYSDNTEASIRENGFGVSCITENGVSVFNEKAEWDNSMNAYRPVSRLFYFPMKESLSFYAVYPFSQPIVVSGNQAFLHYTQNAELDLLAAVRENVVKTAHSVQLTFEHILSLIRFNVVGSDDNVIFVLKKISLSVPSGGEFDYTSFDWNTNAMSNETFYTGQMELNGVTSVPGAMTFVPCEPVFHVEWDTYGLDGVTLIESYSESKSLGRSIMNGEECTVTLKLSNFQADALAFEIIVSPWSETNKSVEFN